LVFLSKGLLIADKNPKKRGSPVLSSFEGRKPMAVAKFAPVKLLLFCVLLMETWEVIIESDEYEWRQKFWSAIYLVAGKKKV
jgi:hypothetical protein